MSDPATVRAARLLLHQLGVTVDDLMWTPVGVPTIAEYLPTVVAAAGLGARTTYSTYWNHIRTALGDRRLDHVSASDIEGLMRQVAAQRVKRRNSQDGVCAAEHLLAAMRAIYTRAITDELLPPHHNPAARIAKPRRRPSPRRALTGPELAAINNTVATTGNDVALDTLLIRLHVETACRRGAAIRLRQDDIDETWCQLRLREKNNTVRWHPASPTLIQTLITHRHERGTHDPTAPLLRYRTGTPLTTRRYDHLWHRVGQHLPWVAAHGITTHWLRHTTITWVERHYGYGIARAYAGHTDNRTGSTTTYIRGHIHEVATALAALTNEPHPLADSVRAVTCRPDGSSGLRCIEPRRPDPDRHVLQRSGRERRSTAGHGDDEPRS
jgi:integrase